MTNILQILGLSVTLLTNTTPERWVPDNVRTPADILTDDGRLKRIPAATNIVLTATITNPAPYTVAVSNLLQTLAAKGDVCAALGHNWQSKPNVNGGYDVLQPAIYYGPSRTCSTCGVTQRLAEFWK